jgi:hypothetical protein
MSRKAELWIRIRIHLAVSIVRIGNADPDPGAWELTKIYKWTLFSAFQKGFCNYVDMFLTYYLQYLKYIFNVKIQFFVTLKSEQDPDLHLDKSHIRIRIPIDVPMRIHNPAVRNLLK